LSESESAHEASEIKNLTTDEQDCASVSLNNCANGFSGKSK
jgi:hypothetical protein